MPLNTASVIFVNDATLKGDLNIGSILEILSKRLTALGYSVKKVSILEESDFVVVNELETFSKHYDVTLIVTNTNLSPVSKALAVLSLDELKVNENVCKKLQLNDNILWPSMIKYKEGYNTIVLYYQRIFILTLDSLVEQLNLSQTILEQYRKEKHLVKVFYVQKNTVLQSFYPVANLDVCCLNSEKGNMIKLSSKFLRTMAQGELRVRSQIDKEILHCEKVIAMEDAIWNSSEPHIQIAFESITKCLRDYGPENIFLSFNGGKDCTVLQHLVQIAIRKKYSDLNYKLLCLYVRNENTFKEQDDFVEHCRIYYDLEVLSISADIKTALSEILEKRPNLKACFMGTRRTDPYCADLKTFKMTDTDWPEVMRCSPILDWHYCDIWEYLLYYKVPYCELYDCGYTSLGSTLNTVPNPSLAYKIGDSVRYLPAYRLLRESQERDGRNVSIVSKM